MIGITIIANQLFQCRSEKVLTFHLQFQYTALGRLSLCYWFQNYMFCFTNFQSSNAAQDIIAQTFYLLNHNDTTVLQFSITVQNVTS